MRLYLCGQSALSMIRYLRKINDDRLFEPPARVRSLTKPVYGTRLFKGISHRAELIIGHAGDVVHALVAKKAQVVSRGGLETHLWSWPVPAGSFLKLEDDLYVSSPAFTFLQMARELDEVELAKLGAGSIRCRRSIPPLSRREPMRRCTSCARLPWRAGLKRFAIPRITV